MGKYILLFIFVFGAVLLLFPIQTSAVATYCSSSSDCDQEQCTVGFCYEAGKDCDVNSNCGSGICNDPLQGDGIKDGECTGFCEYDSGYQDGVSCDVDGGTYGVCSGGFCVSDDGQECSGKPDGHPCVDANGDGGICISEACFGGESDTCGGNQTYCADIDQCITPVCDSNLKCGTDGVCQNAGQCQAACVCSVEGQACDDGDPNTTNDTWSTNSGGSPVCTCGGTGPTPIPLSCTISASPDPVGANVNATITLTDSDIGGHNKHKILYGDGADSGLYDAHNSNQTHAYASNGNYTTTGQLVTYTCGFYLFGCWWYNETVNAQCTDTLTVGPSLVVALSANPNAGDTPFNTNLSATVSGTATGTINYTFWWNCNNSTTSVATAISSCGDPDGISGNANGTKFDGINDNPKTVAHVYSSVGTFVVKVIVERGSAAPAESRVSIPVTTSSGTSPWSESPSWKTPSHAYPQVDFQCTQDTNTCNPPSIFKTNKPIQFIDLTIFGDDSKGKGQRAWLWTFGDSTSSTLQNPTKTYPDPNIYNVTEQVTDKDGFACSLTKPLNVQRPIPIWQEVLPRLGI